MNRRKEWRQTVLGGAELEIERAERSAQRARAALKKKRGKEREKLKLNVRSFDLAVKAAVDRHSEILELRADGQACNVCGGGDGAMVPAGRHKETRSQIFEHEACVEKFTDGLDSRCEGCGVRGGYRPLGERCIECAVPPVCSKCKVDARKLDEREPWALHKQITRCALCNLDLCTTCAEKKGCCRKKPAMTEELRHHKLAGPNITVCGRPYTGGTWDPISSAWDEWRFVDSEESGCPDCWADFPGVVHFVPVEGYRRDPPPERWGMPAACGVESPGGAESTMSTQGGITCIDCLDTFERIYVTHAPSKGGAKTPLCGGKMRTSNSISDAWFLITCADCVRIRRAGGDAAPGILGALSEHFIRARIVAAHNSGAQIVAGTCGRCQPGPGQAGTCCILCAIVENRTTGFQLEDVAGQDLEDLAAERLGMPRQWVLDLISGFDDDGEKPAHPDAFRLGRKFRRKYVAAT